MLSERCRLSSRWNDEIDEFIAWTKKNVIEADLLCWVRDADFLVNETMRFDRFIARTKSVIEAGLLLDIILSQ